MANLCINPPSSAIQVLIFQLLVLRPRPTCALVPKTIPEEHLQCNVGKELLLTFNSEKAYNWEENALEQG